VKQAAFILILISPVCFVFGQSNIPQPMKHKSQNINPSGFNTVNSGLLNRQALQTALNLGGTIKIGKSGQYDIDSTLFIPSNTTLRFCPGVTLRKVQTGASTYFTNLFVNKGAITGVSDSNINIIGNGLNINFNGMDSKSGGTRIPFVSAEICLYRVSNFNVSGITVNDNTAGYEQYFFEMIDCNVGVISEIDLQNYSKDGIDIIHSKNITLRNYHSNTGDDAIFIGEGWYGFDPGVGNTENITIENWTSSAGFGCRMIASAWDDWTTGRQYGATNAGDMCVNAGRVYRKVNTGTLTASVAPTHTSDTLTGADGIKWRVVSSTASYSSNITGVTFKNCSSTNPQTFAYGYQEALIVEPTHRSLIEYILFDGCSWIPNSGVDYSGTKFFSISDGYLGTCEFRNCNAIINNPLGTQASFFLQAVFSTTHASTHRLIINGCNINVAGNGVLLYSYGAVTSDSLRIVNSTFTSTTATSQFIYNSNASQWDSTYINQSSFISLERLLSFSSAGVFNSATMHMRIDTCQFVTPKYVFGLSSGSGASGIMYASGTGNTFTDVANKVFYNNNTTTNMRVGLSSSLGNVVSGKTFYGDVTNYIFYIVDLPDETLPPNTTTQTIQIVATTDNACVVPGWSNSYATNALYLADISTPAESGFRFLGLNTPKSATIVSAHISCTSGGDYTADNANVRIKAEESATPATFSDYANFAGRTRSNALVDWTIPHWTSYWSTLAWFDSPEIKAVIQEIVNLAGWGVGQNITLFIANNGSTASAARSTIDYGTYAPAAAKLTVTWSN
jgi:hypothetical protein